MQRTDAAAADGIVLDNEILPEAASSRPVEDGFQTSLLKIPDRRMKKAGAHTSIHFNYCGNPRRIARGRFGWV